MSEKNKQGSGTAGKPGEAPGGAANARSGAPGQPARGRADASQDASKQTPLTSEGIAHLLKSAFADDSAEAAADVEVQPAAEEAATRLAEGRAAAAAQDEGPETTEEKTARETAEAAAAAAAAEAQTQETAEEQAAREAAEAQAAAAAEAQAPELPAELQSAIDTWEEQGGGQLPPALQTLFDKRIGKLTAQRETEKTRAEAAEARAQELEAELAQARENGGTASAQPGAVPDEKTLLNRKQAFKTFVRDAVGYLEDTATDQERERMEAYMQSNGLDASGLKRHVQQAREVLEDLPEQLQQVRTAAAQYRAQEQAAEPEAKKYFPWLENKTSPEYQEAQKVLQAMPDLKNRTPLHKIVLGVYVLGLREFKKLKTAEGAAGARGAAAKVKVPVRVPPKTPAAGAAAPAAARVNGQAAAETAARQRFEKAPTRESVAELIKIGLRA